MGEGGRVERLKRQRPAFGIILTSFTYGVASRSKSRRTPHRNVDKSCSFSTRNRSRNPVGVQNSTIDATNADLQVIKSIVGPMVGRKNRPACALRHPAMALTSREWGLGDSPRSFCVSEMGRLVKSITSSGGGKDSSVGVVAVVVVAAAADLVAVAAGLRSFGSISAVEEFPFMISTFRSCVGDLTLPVV